MALPSTRARRMALSGLIAIVASGQVSCALELLHVPLPTPWTVLATIVAVVAVAVVLALRRTGEELELARWAAVGILVWTFWGSSYFGAARITDPPNARTFDDAILQRLPLVPAFTSIYLGVHIFSLVPYCALPEARLLRRYLLGNVLIILLASIAWVALPVRLDRPPFDGSGTGFGVWLMSGVYRWDPTTNCFPSAHCSVAVYAAIALRFASRRLFAWGIFTAAAICVSTVMTKQHYLADVATGAVLAALMAYAMRRRSAVGTVEPR